MTEEQVQAGVRALAWAIWSKSFDDLGTGDQIRIVPWVRAVLTAAEATAGAEPPAPPVAEIDRIWKHLADVSSS